MERSQPIDHDEVGLLQTELHIADCSLFTASMNIISQEL
jgi:hypothetical protein